MLEVLEEMCSLLLYVSFLKSTPADTSPASQFLRDLVLFMARMSFFFFTLATLANAARDHQQYSNAQMMEMIHDLQQRVSLLETQAEARRFRLIQPKQVQKNTHIYIYNI